jgi:DNA-binding FadR family transcriptional regulator
MKLSTVAVNRSRAQVVADHLQELIREQGLAPGHNLGTRKQLREALGANGATVDGAIRILADRGIVLIKAGVGGGIFVADPNAGAITLAGGRWQIRQSTGIDRDRVAEVLSVIHALYPMVVAEAALSHDEADLTRMREALEALEAGAANVNSYEMAHHHLHQSILAATHNGVLIETLNPLLVIHHETMAPPIAPDGMEPSAWLTERAQVHRDIVDAIAARDCERAWDALLRHGVTEPDASRDDAGLPAGFVAAQRRWRDALSEPRHTGRGPLGARA